MCARHLPAPQDHPEIDHAEGQKDHRQHDAGRGVMTDALVLERGVVGENRERFGRPCRPAAGHGVDHGDAPERVEDQQQDEDDIDGAQPRQGDVDETGQRPRPVHLGRLVLLLGNDLESCEKDEHGERNLLPGCERDQRRQREVQLRQPGPRLVDNGDHHQQVVANTELRIEHPGKDRHHHDLWNGPGQYEDRRTKPRP